MGKNDAAAQALLAGGVDPNIKGKVSLGNVNFAHALVRSWSTFECVPAGRGCVLFFKS